MMDAMITSWITLDKQSSWLPSVEKPHRVHCHTAAQEASGTAPNGRQTGKQRKTDKVCLHSNLSIASDISKAL